MPDLPFLLAGQDASIEEKVASAIAALQEVFQERIGGAVLGGIFMMAEDDILDINVDDTLEKDNGELGVHISPTGGLVSSASGLGIKVKVGGGAAVGADGLEITGNQFYAFKTVGCPAGTDPVADQPADTVEFTKTNGIKITGDAATDTVEFGIDETSSPQVTGLTGTGDLTFTCGANKTIVLSPSVWDDILPYSINPGTGLTALSAGDYGTTGFKLNYWSENGAANEEIQAFYQLPHSYKEGTDVELHLHVIPPVNGAAGDEDVEFAIEWQWVNIGDAYSSAANTTGSAVFRVGAADAGKHIKWEFAAFAGAGKKISSDIMVRIRRLTKVADRVNDDYTDRVWLRFIDIHFQKDTIGSRQEMVK